MDCRYLLIFLLAFAAFAYAGSTVRVDFEDFDDKLAPFSANRITVNGSWYISVGHYLVTEVLEKISAATERDVSENLLLLRNTTSLWGLTELSCQFSLGFFVERTLTLVLNVITS